MVMKHTMENTIWQSVLEFEKTKTFLEYIVERYVKFDKIKKGQYLSLLKNTMYDGVGGVYEYIMKLINYYN